MSELKLRAEATRAYRVIKTQNFCELEEIIEKGKQAQLILDYKYCTSIPEIDLH